MSHVFSPKKETKSLFLQTKHRPFMNKNVTCFLTYETTQNEGENMVFKKCHSFPHLINKLAQQN